MVARRHSAMTSLCAGYNRWGAGGTTGLRRFAWRYGWRCYTAVVREFVDDERPSAGQAPPKPIRAGRPVAGRSAQP